MAGRITRQFGALLLAAALLLRVAIPAGWMPVAAESGLVLAPCSGTGPIEPADAAPMPAMAGMDNDMAGHGDGGHETGQKSHRESCPFAALALAAPPAEPVVLLLPGVAYLPPAEARHAAFSRAGIGAPPRPATGPPLSV